MATTAAMWLVAVVLILTSSIPSVGGLSSPAAPPAGRAAAAAVTAPNRLPLLGHSLLWLRCGDAAELVDHCRAHGPIVRLESLGGGAPVYVISSARLAREASARRGCPDRIDPTSANNAAPGGGCPHAEAAVLGETAGAEPTTTTEGGGGGGLTLGAGSRYELARRVVGACLSGTAAQARARAAAAAKAREAMDAAEWRGNAADAAAADDTATASPPRDGSERPQTVVELRAPALAIANGVLYRLVYGVDVPATALLASIRAGSGRTAADDAAGPASPLRRRAARLVLAGRQARALARFGGARRDGGATEDEEAARSFFDLVNAFTHKSAQLRRVQRELLRAPSARLSVEGARAALGRAAVRAVGALSSASRGELE